MRALGLLILVGLSLACQEEPAPTPRSAAVEQARSPLLEDDRVRELLSHARSEPFLEDTSDLLPVLASKLEFSLPEPLHAAKRELALLGSAALPELTRVFERNAADPQLTPRAVNAMEVAARMPQGQGHALLLRGLAHPSGSVRLAALRGMRTAAQPSDFEALLEQAPLTGAENFGELAAALWCSDRERTARELPQWIERRTMPPLVILALGPRLPSIATPATLELFRELAPKVEGEMRARLWAALAKHGDVASLSSLREWLADPLPGRRELAAHCLRDAGLGRELAERLSIDDYVPIRKLAAQALSEVELDEAARSQLSLALSDPSEEVRGVALGSLVRAGVPLAENEALELLKGERSDLERALVVLRDAWGQRSDLANRALHILVGLDDGSIGPVRVERSSLWRAIGLVPLPQAAQYLYARIPDSPSPTQGMSAHRWFVTQLGNTGAAGRSWVRERWLLESDPERRLDLMMVSQFEPDDAAREFLFQAFESGRMSPPEQLYAASNLARIGPATVVAPLLKRVALEISDPIVRPAFNNLLWAWYGRGT